MRFRLAALIAMLAATPAFAIEPERREAVVAHNRVWDGHAYQENFVPSQIEEIYLLSKVDNAVNFVRTQEYYWPLARQTYVAFERQRDEVDGTLVIRNSKRIIEEVGRELYSIHYPNGAVSGDGELLWGEQARQAHAQYRREERAFIENLASVRQAHTAYERALRESAIARIQGQAAANVPPPPPRPAPLLKLVTEPQPAFRINLPAGRYTAVITHGGTEVPGTRRNLEVIDHDGSDSVVFDIVPEERWTRPIQSNGPKDRIYVHPGARFFVTAHEARRFQERDYLKLVRPQAALPPDRPIWVRQKPADVETMRVAWDGSDGPTDTPLTSLKVIQTQGSSFGYVVREAAPDEIADLAAFPVVAPGGDVAAGSIAVGHDGGSSSRDVIVVRPRQAGLAWSLALLPAAVGLCLSWIGWSRRQ